MQTKTMVGWVVEPGRRPQSRMATGRAAPDPVPLRDEVQDGVAARTMPPAVQSMARSWPSQPRKPRFAGSSWRGLNVVHRHARVAAVALDQVGDRRAGEDVAGGGRGLGEDAVRAGAERAVEELDHVEDGDLRGVARE